MLLRKKAALALGALVAAAMLAGGCGRNIDVEETGAVSVPGARGLHRFCDGPTLIYVSVWDGTDDEYEWFYPGGCIKDAAGKWVFNEAVPDYAVPNGDSTDDAND